MDQHEEKLRKYVERYRCRRLPSDMATPLTEEEAKEKVKEFRRHYPELDSLNRKLR